MQAGMTKFVEGNSPQDYAAIVGDISSVIGSMMGDNAADPDLQSLPPFVRDDLERQGYLAEEGLQLHGLSLRIVLVTIRDAVEHKLRDSAQGYGLPGGLGRETGRMAHNTPDSHKARR